MFNRNATPRSPRLSLQSQRTDSTVVTQIYDPRRNSEASQHPRDDFELDLQGSQPWRAQRGWEFLPPKSPTKSSTSPTTPNFSRPFGARKRESHPPLDAQSEEPYLEDHPEEDYFGRGVGRENNQTERARDNSAQPVGHTPKSKGNRKARYSSRSLYSYAGSEDSSRARTETSSSSDSPLISQSQTPSSVPHNRAPPGNNAAVPYRNIEPHSQTGISSNSNTAPIPRSRPATSAPRYRPQPAQALHSQHSSSSGGSSRARTETSSGSDTPLVARLEQSAVRARSPVNRNATIENRRSINNPLAAHPIKTSGDAAHHPPQPAQRPLSTHTVDQSPQEPILDMEALDEPDVLTALPIIASNRPPSVASAAEPPPMIRDGRMLNGRGKASATSSNSSGSPDRRGKPSQHQTQMTSWPEVQRPTQDRPGMPDRSWSASNVDTSSLSPEKIAKLKKKGINPALWLEMKQAQGKKGRFGLSPLVGNTFLGS